MAVAHNNIGALYLKVKQPAKAVERFRRAIECDPSFAAARLNLAWAYLTLDWKGPALEELRAYAALVPKDHRDPAAVQAMERLEKR
jgi:Tfp pilus assembly protein PilF